MNPPARLISVDTALEKLFSSIEQTINANAAATLANETSIEQLDLLNALGRVLANNIASPVNVPPADNSAMDGYAFKFSSAEVADGALPIQGRIRAGDQATALQSGTAARIFTGAEIPHGADTVVMQENCQTDGELLQVLTMPTIGSNIRPAGQDVIKGAEVLRAGTRLQAQHIGLLASVGCQEVPVRKKIRVGILSTGNELVEPGNDLQSGQIYNSNRYQLASLLTSENYEVVDFGLLADNRQATSEIIDRAIQQVDVLISSGGVSVGEEDYVRAVLEDKGGLHFWKVAIKPGKPFTFGLLRSAGGQQVPYFGLPGNPVAVFVTCALFVLPCLGKLQGQCKAIPDIQTLTAGFSWQASPKRQEYLRVRKSVQDARKLELYPNQSSGVLSSVAWADGFAVVQPGKDLQEGEPVDYISFNSFLS